MPVQLHPGFLAALAQGLAEQAAGGEQVAAELTAEFVQQIGVAADAGQPRQELVVVAGDPLGEPEAGHNRGAVVVDRGELRRPQPPHVPLVQVFMAHQLQKPAVAARLGQLLHAVLKHGGVVVLKAAEAPLQQVQHKQVGGGGRSRCTHQPAAGGTHRRHVVEQVGVALQQRIGVSPHRRPAHPAVRHPVHREAMPVVRPRLHRSIHQLVEAAGDPAVFAWPAEKRQRHERLPAVGQQQLQVVRHPARPVHLQRQGGQGQAGVVVVEVAGAHRELGGHGGVVHLHRQQVLELGGPHRRLTPHQRHRHSRLNQFQVLQLAHVIALQVGARRPHRQAQLQRLVGGGETKPTTDQMLARGRQIQRELHRIQGRQPAR